ncbi:MAG: ABC transporter substrate-binding protein [Bacteroidetes bacterium]|nr:ABC transporter substrate-binding protein [Bacteroidota bacterium]
MLKTFTDQLKRQVAYNFPPKRIISLVPSQTEFLADIGLSNELVGITKFCIHPEEIFKSKTRVGGTKNINFDKIKQLSPDLIICNKEENEKLQVEGLAKHFPVYISDIVNLEDAYEMMHQLGEICGKEEQANKIIEKCRQGFEALTNQINTEEKTKTLYLIWKKPYMAAGTDNFINVMLEKAGFENILKSNSRYPEITETEMIALAPELILLSSEPYPFREKHIQELQGILPESKIILVDGEIFSWYGSRLLKGPGYLKNLRNSCSFK